MYILVLLILTAIFLVALAHWGSYRQYMIGLSAAYVLLLCVFFVRFLMTGSATNPDPNHAHADFAMWFDGEKFDFSQQKYMSEAPRANAEGEIVPTEIPGRRHLHLHDGNGHIIHRHKPGLTLGDFFRSIGFTMTKTCLKTDEGREACDTGKSHWRMIVNGEERPMDPGYVFNDLDQILLSYSASDTAYQDQWKELTDEACKYSQTCPWRGKPPTENCIADPEVPCVVQ